MKTIHKHILNLFLVVTAFGSLHGQQRASSTQAIVDAQTRQPTTEAVDQTVNELVREAREAAQKEAIREDAGDVAFLGGKAPSPDRFFVRFQNLLEYVSNADYRGSTGRADLMWNPAIEGGWSRQMGSGIGVAASVRVDSVKFVEVQENDFWGPSGDVQVFWQMKPSMPVLRAGFRPSSYSSMDTDQRILDSLSNYAGFEHSVPVNQGRTALFYGFEYAQFHTSPSFSDRDAFKPYGGVTQVLRDDLFLQLFYVFQWSDYHKLNREDSRNIAGLSLTHVVNQNLQLRLGGTFTDNDSNLTLAEYQSFNAGLNAVLNWKF
ncbi:MAG: outer membrane beta-barrel protein [Verrucomicrobiae bacterium]|nr:outer membrane beta-barrel protein [Verrucomicrobiae bacterium]